VGIAELIRAVAELLLSGEGTWFLALAAMSLIAALIAVARNWSTRWSSSPTTNPRRTNSVPLPKVRKETSVALA
jgi:hypothetical protein